MAETKRNAHLVSGLKTAGEMHASSVEARDIMKEVDDCLALLDETAQTPSKKQLNTHLRQSSLYDKPVLDLINEVYTDDETKDAGKADSGELENTVRYQKKMVTQKSMAPG